MSSYFDAKRRGVLAADKRRVGDDRNFLQDVQQIEEAMYDEVKLVTGDREFPEDLRQQIMGQFALNASFQMGDVHPSGHVIESVISMRMSLLIDEVHELFHELARRGITARFGRLGDCPRQILVLRDEYEGELMG